MLNVMLESDPSYDVDLSLDNSSACEAYVENVVDTDSFKCI